jgi:regulatory protein
MQGQDLTKNFKIFLNHNCIMECKCFTLQSYHRKTEDLMFKRKSKTKQPSSATHAYEYCMFLLNLRLRSEGELRHSMTERGYEQPIMDEVINRLFDLHYIDDARFAEILVDNYKKYKNYGYLMIKKKLFEKRLSHATIEVTLDTLFTAEDELSVAKRFVKKEKLGIATQEDKQRLARKLQSRGFRGAVFSALISS